MPERPLMTTVRDDYNYRRIAKPPRVAHGSEPGIRVFVSHAGPDADTAQMVRKSLDIAQRESILLRTARAERALYTERFERTYETQADAIAVRRNNLGMKYLEHDLPKAFRNFLDAVAQDETFALAHNNLGLVSLEIGDLYRAIEHLNKAIELDDALDIAYCNRGLAHLELGDFEAAYEDFEKALELDQYDPMHYNNIGVLFLDLEVPAKARDYFDTAIELDPSNPLAYRNRGLAYREMGDHQQARADFTKATALDEEQYQAMFGDS